MNPFSKTNQQKFFLPFGHYSTLTRVEFIFDNDRILFQKPSTNPVYKIPFLSDLLEKESVFYAVEIKPSSIIKNKKTITIQSDDSTDIISVISRNVKGEKTDFITNLEFNVPYQSKKIELNIGTPIKVIRMGFWKELLKELGHNNI